MSQSVVTITAVAVLLLITTSGIGASESPVDWKKYPDPVLEIGENGEWDDGHVDYPMVIKTESLYEMWYTGGHVGPYSGNNKIGYANSTDGIQWTKYDGNPVVSTGSGWDSYYAYGPTVIKDGDTYKMWYAGYPGGTHTTIGYATSPDGINWEKYPANPVLNTGAGWDSRYVENPTVIKDGSVYKMWYVGNSGACNSIGYATSTDGIHWTKSSDNPVLEGEGGSIGRPKVIKDDSVYRMYYRGNHAIYGNYRACYATSTDGINWEIYSDNPILELGEPGTWDDYGTDHPMVIKDGTTYEMWYAGYEENPSYSNNRIGYATMTSESNTLLTIISQQDGATVYTPSITVTVTASDPSGIASVTVNGAIAKKDTSDWSTWSADVTLAEGENPITVVATNGEWLTTTKTITVTYKDVGKYALIIGINDYPEGTEDLSYSVNSAFAIYTLLTVGYGFPDDQSHVSLLTDSSANEALVRSEIGRFKTNKKIDEDDIFVFYFAGHGQRKDEVEKTLYDNISLYDNDISDVTLMAWLNNFNGATVIAIFDSCYSGGLAYDTDIDPYPVGINGDKRVVLMSSAADKKSHEIDELSKAIFTHYLYSAFVSKRNEANRDVDPRVSLEEAFSYAQKKTDEYIIIPWKDQHPQMMDHYPTAENPNKEECYFSPDHINPTFIAADAGCPIHLHAYDYEGRHTGINSTGDGIEENIPGSYYSGPDFDPETIVVLGQSDNITYRIEALNEGEFNFTITQTTDTKTITVLYENISITETTNATVVVNSSNPSNTMELDYDGDGTVDRTIAPIQILINYAPSVLLTTPAGVQRDNITISYNLKDAESDNCTIMAQYSLDNNIWLDATIGEGGDGVFNVTSTPTGVDHTFVWASGADLQQTNATVHFRIRPYDGDLSGDYATTDAFDVDNRVSDDTTPPVAIDDTANTDEDTAITIDVAANDNDADGNLDPMTANTDCITCFGPAHGMLANNHNGTFTYTPDPDYNGPDNFIYEICDTDELCDTATVTIDVTGVNDAPVVSVDVIEQNLQYSDGIANVMISATDVDSSSLTISTSWTKDGGNVQQGLPSDLILSEGYAILLNSLPPTWVWILEGQAMVDAGTYNITFTISDGEDEIEAYTTLVVEPEGAAVAFDNGNPVAVQVAEPDGNSEAFSLILDVTEAIPDMALLAYPGDISLAEVSMTLVPVGPGSPAEPTSCLLEVVGTGYDTILTVICEFNDVAVNTYAVQVTVDGGYYTGLGEDVLVIYDPSLGFTTGGGTFLWPETGEKTNFGYTMKYNKKATNIKGNLLLVRHLQDGTIYRVKSNALHGLALGESEDDGETFGWASFSGKATYLEPGWDEPIGNHEFIMYVEDRGQPGNGIDRIWIKVKNQDNTIDVMSMDDPTANNAVVINGGNIVVPHK